MITKYVYTDLAEVDVFPPGTPPPPCPPPLPPPKDEGAVA